MNDQSQLKQIAKSIGFCYMEHADSELMFAVDQVYQGRDHLRFDDVLVKKSGQITCAIGKLEWVSSSDKSVHRRQYEQTTVIFESPDHEFPPLSLEPADLRTRVFGALMSLVGVSRLRTGDHPDFDRQFHVATLVPEAARPLLTAELIEFFLANPDISLSTNGHRFGVAYKFRSVPATEASKLLRTATKLARLLTRIEQSTRLQRPTVADSVKSNGNHPPGSLLRMAMGPRITRREQDEFLAQSTPRQIPAAVQSLKLGFGSVFTMLAGMAVESIGLVSLVLGVSSQRSELMVAGTAMQLIGFIAMLLAWLYRRRAKRILRDGQLAHATVTSIERTNVEVNNQRRYKVTFAFQLNGRETKQRTNQYGPAVQAASVLKQKQQTTRLLVDPVNPRSILWLAPYVQ